MLTCHWGDESLRLLPGPMVFWPRNATAFIADPHFGKGAAFRRAGIPVPTGSTARDLERLSQLIESTSARHLVILGDFLHAKASRSPLVIEQLHGWRSRWPSLEVTLVRGNHDRSAGDPPRSLLIQAVDPGYRLTPFQLHHEPPEPMEDAWVLCGHRHPAIRLSNSPRASMVIPCFWFQPRVAVLPAFGSFTGTHRVHPAALDQVFLVTEDAVLALPTKSGRS